MQMYICNLTKHFTMNIRSVYILLLFFLLASCGGREWASIRGPMRICMVCSYNFWG